MKMRILGAVLVALGLGLAAFTFSHSTSQSRTSLVFSGNNMLSSLWRNFKTGYIEPSSGRVMDPADSHATTSEGQSYCLLRAVWQDDKPTFDKCWAFARDNLARPGDHLFAWKYGELGGGKHGVLTAVGGQNSASDADSDIAFALIMAYGRWQEPAYLQQAKPIIDDIWKHEVVMVQGRPVLVANNLEAGNQKMIINPSYWSPYAYRVFANVDRSHPWRSLVDSTYTLLGKTMSQPLDQSTAAGLPPDWATIDRTTGVLAATGHDGLKTDYSFDALRVPWRLALDARWNKEDRAKALLAQMKPLGDQWSENQRLLADYTHAGKPAVDYESPAMYGGAMGYFVGTSQSTDIYNTKIKALYREDTKSWAQPQGYYNDNWLWFGAALELDALQNLASGVKP
jgi:endo-1,4-beta-D-glucanase Y